MLQLGKLTMNFVHNWHAVNPIVNTYFVGNLQWWHRQRQALAALETWSSHHLLNQSTVLQETASTQEMPLSLRLLLPLPLTPFLRPSDSCRFGPPLAVAVVAVVAAEQRVLTS